LTTSVTLSVPPAMETARSLAAREGTVPASVITRSLVSTWLSLPNSNFSSANFAFTFVVIQASVTVSPVAGAAFWLFWATSPTISLALSAVFPAISFALSAASFVASNGLVGAFPARVERSSSGPLRIVHSLVRARRTDEDDEDENRGH
jgi:hypothetical protein